VSAGEGPTFWRGEIVGHAGELTDRYYVEILEVGEQIKHLSPDDTFIILRSQIERLSIVN
jgi:hypothetical protein